MTAPIPVDLIERLRAMASELRDENDNGLRYKPVAAELCHQASLALSQAQGRIGELTRLEKTADDLAWHNAAKVEAAEAVAAQWKARAQAAEGLLKEAGEVIETFAIMANADTEYLPDEHVVSLTYDDSELDADLGGPNTLLGERYMRAVRRARSFLSKLTPGEGGGSSGVEALAHVAGATEMDTAEGR